MLSCAEVERLWDDAARGAALLDYTAFKRFTDALAAAAVKRSREKGLRNVPTLLTEHDGEVVQEVLNLARRLYVPEGVTLTAEQFLQLERNFALGYNAVKDTDFGRALLSEVGRTRVSDIT